MYLDHFLHDKVDKAQLLEPLGERQALSGTWMPNEITQ